LLHKLFMRVEPSLLARSEQLLAVREALEAGRAEQALAGLAEELRRQLQDPLALVLCADAFLAYGQALQALELVQRARASAPALTGLRLVEAQQLLLLERHAEARVLLEPIVRGDFAGVDATTLALVRERLARVWLGLQRPEQALEVLQPLLDGVDTSPMPTDLAVLAAELMLVLRRPAQALPWAAQAHSSQGTPSSARLLARCHFLLDDQEGYGQVLVAAAQSWPQDGELAALAALALFDRPHSEAGWTLVEAALQQAGASPALRFVAARQWLIRGDFERGWSDYEARLDLPDNNLYAPCPQGWRQQSPRGRTVVVVAEQGVGDVLFLSRFLPPLLEDASRVLLLVEPRLMPLLQRSHPRLVVLDQVDLARVLAGPEALWIPLGSLPLRYGGDRAAISKAAAQPQLRLSPRLLEHWRLRLEEQAGQAPRIGVSLTAGAQHQEYQARKRSIDPEVVLAPLRGLPVTAIDLQHRDQLQMEAGGESSMFQILRLEPITRDLDHLCAVLANLDLLITSDQTNAFLGGMLGLRTLVIVPPNPHFMLMHEGQRTPWFDSLRIVRAPHWRDWAGVADAYQALLAESLAELPVRGSGM